MSPDNRALVARREGDEWHFALHGGEDYELLFTAAPARAGAACAQRITAETGTPVTIIGEITPGRSPRAGPARRQLTPAAEAGWDHFAARQPAGTR